jgi:hypothetical protein
MGSVSHRSFLLENKLLLVLDRTLELLAPLTRRLSIPLNSIITMLSYNAKPKLIRTLNQTSSTVIMHSKFRISMAK